MADGTQERALDYGQAIRTLREERGMTLETLAESAGISASYLSEVERGLKRPSSDVVAKIAEAFGMLPSGFLEYVESLSSLAAHDVEARMESPRARRAYLASPAAPAAEPAWSARSDRTLRLLMSHARQLEAEDLKTLVDIARRLIKRGKQS
jgi:transcriptional regulator with XRE-family HTH domain